MKNWKNIEPGDIVKMDDHAERIAPDVYEMVIGEELIVLSGGPEKVRCYCLQDEIIELPVTAISLVRKHVGNFPEAILYGAPYADRLEEMKSYIAACDQEVARSTKRLHILKLQYDVAMRNVSKLVEE